MLNKGFVLEKRYKIVSVAGKGGTSVVYRAVDLRANNAQRAVKEVMKTNGSDAYNAKNESLLIKEFYEKDVKNSFFPNIIEIIDNDPNALYIVQDYINGVSMEKLLEYGPFRPKTVIKYAKDICYVLAFIHKCGYIHSDMKPDNIMVVRDEYDLENNKRPDKFGKLKFVDFGSVIQRQEGTFAYTPAYAAPEQFNQEELDEQTDIFNIGATMYHMLTGKKPKNVSSKGELVSSAERFVFEKGDNAGLVRIIRKCVSDDKTKRFRSCDELYDELERTDNHTYVRATGIVAGLAALSLGMSLFSGIMANKSRNEDFNKLVEIAENTAEYSERSRAFEKVISVDGSYADAYLKLIELYKDDNVFDAKETEQLLALVNENINALKKNPQYERVAYEIGILYWYYYFYGNSGDSASRTGKISSVKWFKEAQSANFKKTAPDEYEIAQVYCAIGDFYSQTQKKEKEILKKNFCKDLWESMNALNKLVEEANADSEIIILETYKTLMNLVNENMSDFVKSGISLDEQKNFLDDVKAKTEKVQATDDSAIETKEYILGFYDGVAESIEGSK